MPSALPCSWTLAALLCLSSSPLLTLSFIPSTPSLAPHNAPASRRPLSYTQLSLAENDGTQRSTREDDFKAALSSAPALCARLEANPSDPSIEEALVECLSTHGGTRGFLASYLSDANLRTPDWDDVPQPLARALVEGDPHTSEILIKNLIMSSASAVARERSGPGEGASALMVARRTAKILKTLGLMGLYGSNLRGKMQSARAAIGDRRIQGYWMDFYTGMGYDGDQMSAIARNIDQVADYLVDRLWGPDED